MNSLRSLYSRLNKIKASVPHMHENMTPCLVPPPDMYLFTGQERHALREIELRVVWIIPTGLGSVIQRLGGPYQALFAICAPVDWSFREMGIYELAVQELSNQDWWFLRRWWDFYKNMIVSSVPQGRRDRNRRYILCSVGDLVEQFLQIDIELHRARIEKASYPFSMQSYTNYRQSIYEHIEQNKPFHPYYMLHNIEMWLDFINGYHTAY
jgi:hypothetical protein